LECGDPRGKLIDGLRGLFFLCPAAGSTSGITADPVHVGVRFDKGTASSRVSPTHALSPIANSDVGLPCSEIVTRAAGSSAVPRHTLREDPIQNTWKNGTTGVVLRAEVFLLRLAGLMLPAGVNAVRYYRCSH
jgi:hypothetical protein